MGPMGPMGPIMGGGSWGDAIATIAGWLVLTVVLAALVGIALGLGALALWREDDPRDRRRSRTPEEVLGDRYAQGKITREQYREALIDLLKDRYVRGELDLDEYQARLERLLLHPVSSPRPEPGPPARPNVRR